jgi:hypothetical protein
MESILKIADSNGDGKVYYQGELLSSSLTWLLKDDSIRNLKSTWISTYLYKPFKILIKRIS